MTKHILTTAAAVALLAVGAGCGSSSGTTSTVTVTETTGTACTEVNRAQNDATLATEGVAIAASRVLFLGGQASQGDVDSLIVTAKRDLDRFGHCASSDQMAALKTTISHAS